MSGYDFIIEDRVPVIVYDVSIENIEDRRSSAKIYESMKKASQVLQIRQMKLIRAIKNKKRIFSPYLQKEIAVRYQKQTL
jgi:hypothetical protein